MPLTAIQEEHSDALELFQTLKPINEYSTLQDTNEEYTQPIKEAKCKIPKKVSHCLVTIPTWICSVGGPYQSECKSCNISGGAASL